MKQDDFQAFVAKLKPHVTGPAGPQIYNTDSAPATAFASSVTEVFRIPAPDVEKEQVVRTAWRRLVDAAQAEGASVKELSGTSLNLEDKLFLGILGWEGLAARDKMLGQKNVVVAREVVESLGGGSFVAEFGKAGVLLSD